ncbi:hypothetical protein [Aliidiomarina celeris]|uniref:hypothetical protein n=1 Tax=Aliidiomarina celeris TaxID=2249428 RepID=UPI000DE86D78|nr:hypothetical protein [Aliidiomarina celeris]
MYNFIKNIVLASIVIFSTGLVSCNVSANQLENKISIEKLVETLPSSERDSSRQALLRLHDEAKIYSIDFELKSVSLNTDFDDDMSTMSASCTVRATVRILGQEAEVSATAPTCTEAYDMLRELIGQMVP